MKEFSVFVITAAACVFFLTGCGVASDSTSSVGPDTPHTESTAQPTATPIITPAPDAESSEAVEKSLFDPASADYTGSVVEMTDTGFTLSPTVVQRQGADASAAVMAEAGASSSWFSVMCTDDTRYIAIYADGNGSSSQAEGSADMVQAGAMVYITGSNTDSGFTADTVAILNP